MIRSFLSALKATGDIAGLRPPVPQTANQESQQCPRLRSQAQTFLFPLPVTSTNPHKATGDIAGLRLPAPQTANQESQQCPRLRSQAQTFLFSFLLFPISLSAQTLSFNRDIRPILSDKCFTCHGPDAANRKTKLRFDTESGYSIELREGKHAFTPGDPDHSEAYRRISSQDKTVRMPPAYLGRDKLSDKEISLIKTWIEQGAKYEPFWSFIPPVRPAVPASDWARNPIDNFVYPKLLAEGLKPSPEADKRTLIRRVSLDLTGIPPTPAEVDAFLSDSSPNAYEKVVDRLLASPRYGERMAFRWMENARYGDTNGYQTDGPREMWRWRDWVIDAFNKNMPYDEFTVDQLAGDLLPHPTRDQIIATGFNRNHRTNGEGGIIPEEYRVEYVADRAQTTSIVWMGLTMGCARCHDHKYDPIAQKDFYRLFAYFNRIPNERGFSYNYGNEEPTIKAPLPDQEKQLAELDQKVATLSAKWDRVQRQIEKGTEHSVPNPQAPLCPDFVCGGRSAPSPFRFPGIWQSPTPPITRLEPIANFGYMEPFTFSAWIKPESATGGILSQAEDYLEGQGHSLYLMEGKLRLHIVLRWTDLALRIETINSVPLNEWHHVTATYDGKRKAAGAHLYIDGIPQETKILFDQNDEPFKVDAKKIPFRIGAAGGLAFKGSIEGVRVDKEALLPEEVAALAARETPAQIAAIPVAQRTPAQLAKLRLAFFDAGGAPPNLKKLRTDLLAARKEREKYYDSIPTVMVMVDDPNARQSYLLKRGAYDSHGEVVTPGIPAILPRIDPNLPANRLGLAKWFVDRRNPLTARVTVNRFWQSYFGFGIVKTVDDFGSQGEWPVNPPLLDWLAVEFMESGWNVKAMQRLIVTSATYRQQSKVTPELLQKDPDNRLLARGPRLRLGPEIIRDQALAASGLLVEKIGGPSVKPYQPPGLWQELSSGGGYVQDKGEGLYRRSLYTYWKRTVAPPFMGNFDSPNREVCTVYENRTNTPLQALDLMNDTIFLEASRKLAERMLTEGGNDPAHRIDHAYELLLARPPKPSEQHLLLNALSKFETNYQKDPKAAEAFLNYGASPRNRNLPAPELAAYTSIASMILNLDAVISKE